ncbi:MAG: radical SAM protein [Peptococcaceae bacterium]
MQNTAVSFKYKDLLPLLQGRIPGQLIMQYTDKCNATCPQCSMRITKSFPRSKIDMNDAKRIIDAAADMDIKALSLTGGEPLLFLEEIISLLNYAGARGISYLRTGTNGFIFMNWESRDFTKKIHCLADSLAGTPVRNFWISIDSAKPEIHEKMRGLPGVIKGIEKALPILHEYGIFPAANLGINRNIGGLRTLAAEDSRRDPEVYYQRAQEAFQEFYNFVADLGFTMVNTCYPMSSDEDGFVYGAVSDDEVVRFTPREKVLLFKALYDVIPRHRSQLRIFTPRSSLYAFIRQYEGKKDFCLPCRGGTDFFFIDCRDLEVYPCGYRAEDKLGKLWNLDLNKITGQAYCTECDWECFRDPSELMGQLVRLTNNPLGFLSRIVKEREYLKVWLEDLLYYKKCAFFDGRQPINWT